MHPTQTREKPISHHALCFVTTSAGIASLTHNGPSNFAIVTYTASDADLIVNEIGNYVGNQTVQSGCDTWDITAHPGMWMVQC